MSVASVISRSVSPYYYLKADSGASKHFIRQVDSVNLTEVKKLTNGPLAKLPDNTYIRTNSTSLLPFLPTLSKKAQQALIYPGLKMRLCCQ